MMVDLGFLVKSIPISIFQGFSFPTLLCIVLMNNIASLSITSIFDLLCPRGLRAGAGYAVLVSGLVSATGILFGYNYVACVQVVLALSAGLLSVGKREKHDSLKCGSKAESSITLIVGTTLSPLLALFLLYAKASGSGTIPLLPSWCLYILLNLMLMELFFQSEQMTFDNISFMLPTPSLQKSYKMLIGLCTLLANAIQYGYLLFVPCYLVTCKGIDSLHALMLIFAPLALSLLVVQLCVKTTNTKGYLVIPSLLLFSGSACMLYFTFVDGFATTIVLLIIVQTSMAVLSHSLASTYTKFDILKGSNCAPSYYVWNFLGAILGLTISLYSMKLVFYHSMEQDFLQLKNRLPEGLSIDTFNVLRRKALADPTYIYGEGLPQVVVESVPKALLKAFQSCFLGLVLLSFLLAFCCAFVRLPIANCEKSDLA